MYKPKKPEESFTISEEHYISAVEDDDYYDISVQEIIDETDTFIAEINKKHNLSLTKKDIRFNKGDCFLAFYKTIPNPNYDEEMKKYNEEMEKWVIFDSEKKKKQNKEVFNNRTISLAVDFVKKNLTRNGEVSVNGVVYKLDKDNV